MSTFEVSFTDQGNPFSSNPFNELVLTIEHNVHQIVCFTNALSGLLRGLSKFFDFITWSIKSLMGNLLARQHRSVPILTSRCSRLPLLLQLAPDQ
jgi:hypothetical protein